MAGIDERVNSMPCHRNDRAVARAAAADKFWNEEPFAKNGGYRGDYRIIRWVFGD